MSDKPMTNWKLLPIVIISVIALVLLFRYFDKQKEAKLITVKYELKGDAPVASVNFINLHGNMQQFTDITLPWSFTEYIEVPEPRNFYLQLQGSTMEEGSIQSRIYINNYLAKESFSRGKYVSAIASVLFSSEDEVLK